MIHNRASNSDPASAQAFRLTLFFGRVHGTSVMTLKEYLQHRAEGAAVPPLDFINLAVKLLRVGVCLCT